MNNQKGISNLVVVGLVAVLVLAAVWYVTNKKGSGDYFVDDSMEMMEENGSSSEYEELTEYDSTPEEIDNEAVEELDQLIKDLDENTITDEEINSL